MPTTSCSRPRPGRSCATPPLHACRPIAEIIKFDKVSPDSVVMTSDDSNRRYIEIWVRTATGWKLARMNELATYAIHS